MKAKTVLVILLIMLPIVVSVLSFDMLIKHNEWKESNRSATLWVDDVDYISLNRAYDIVDNNQYYFSGDIFLGYTIDEDKTTMKTTLYVLDGYKKMKQLEEYILTKKGYRL